MKETYCSNVKHPCAELLAPATYDYTSVYFILNTKESLSKGIKKNMQPVPHKPDLNRKPNFMRTIILRLWPIAIGLVLVLFPFDWLANVWPAYRQVFEQVFVGAREHHFGHITLFFIVGLLILLNFPVLRSRPLLYFGLLISAALAQEAVQALFKLQIPHLIDGLDLLFDAIGFTVAYLIVWGWQFISRWGNA